MKIVRIGKCKSSRAKSIELKDLKDPRGNDLELPSNPKNDLVFDPRPIWYDRNGYTFDIEIQDDSTKFILAITRTDKDDEGWQYDIDFRVYNKTKEDVPPFDSSVPYIYQGLNKERAPFDTVVAKVHHTVTKIKREAFADCSEMTTCDMTDAPVEEIEWRAFGDCRSLRTVLLSQVLKKIASRAFGSCNEMEVLILPSTVTHIGRWAFAWCPNMRILKLPDAIDLDNVYDDIIDCCNQLQAAVPTDTSPKQWLKDRYDKYPLHKVCYNANVTIEEIQQSIDKHPNVCLMLDGFNMTALHCLASNPFATAVGIKTLCNECPKAVTIQDKDGCCPLHLAAKTACASTRINTFRSLALAKNENGDYATTMSDNDNNTATALVMGNDSATDEIRAFLYSIGPISRGEIKDSESTQRLEKVIQNYINEFQVNFAKNVGNMIDAEKFGFVRYVSACLDDNDDSHYISRWVAFFHNTNECPLPQLKLIAEWKGKGGRKVSEYAVPAIKEAIQLRLAFLGRYDLIKSPVVHKSDTAIVIKAQDLKSEEFYQKKFDAFFSNEQARKQGLDHTQFEQLVEQMGGDFVNDGLDAEFDRFDQSNDKKIQREEYLQFCKKFFDGGHNRLVALKFMSNVDQFDKEWKFRESNGKDLSKVVVAVEHADHEITEDEFEKVRHAISATGDDWPLYKMVLVMTYGDRNLDSIYRFEQPDLNRVRSYIEEISTALIQLHRDGKVCHGDLAMRNIVRFNGVLKLIDMDASAYIPTDHDYSGLEARYYVGLKFSSGILPPEMIAELGTDGFQKYKSHFTVKAEDESKYWEKIEPMVDDQVAYVVKTFKVYEVESKNLKGEKFFKMEIVDKTTLPYDLVLASEAIDLWSLGVLFYTLIKGQPLFDVDRNDDLKTVDAFKELFLWSDDIKRRKLEGIKDAAARDLLEKLLSRDPSRRGPLNEVLEHVFFKTGKAGQDKQVLEKLDQIAENQRVYKEHMKKIEEITLHISGSITDQSRKLMNAIFESTEVKVPTCFIICPYNPDMLDNIDVMMNRADNFLSKIKYCTKVITDFSKENLMEAVRQFSGGKEETYSLFLIDEHTGEKLDKPYKIRLNGSTLADYVPIMLNGLRVVSVANKVGNFVKSIFPPAALIPTASAKSLDEFREGIEALSSRDPELITEAAKSEESRTFRGAKLREFEEFLREIESKQKLNFCGLRRVCDGDGNAIWVTEGSYELIKQNFNNESIEMRRQRDAAIAEKEAALAEAIAEKEAAVAAVIAKKNEENTAAIAEKDKWIAMLEQKAAKKKRWACRK